MTNGLKLFLCPFLSTAISVLRASAELNARPDLSLNRQAPPGVPAGIIPPKTPPPGKPVAASRKESEADEGQTVSATCPDRK